MMPSEPAPAGNSNGDRVVWGVGTSRTLRAHWALQELELPYLIEPIRTRTPDTETDRFKRVNPRQKIPVLHDGDVQIGESAAIVTYLGETYGKCSAPLTPVDKVKRARFFEWTAFVAMELDATSLYVLRRHWSLPQIYGESPVAVEASEAYFARMIVAAEQMLGSTRPYLLGDDFSGADIMMTTTLTWAIDYNQPLPQTFLDYRERCIARPAYQRAVDINQPPKQGQS